MTWWAVFRLDNRENISTGQVVAPAAELALKGFDKVNLGDIRPDQPDDLTDAQWNPATLVFDRVAKAVKPKAEQLASNIELTIQELVIELRGLS